MINITNLKIDSNSLIGSGAILTKVIPYFEYIDGKRASETPLGYKYEVALLAHNLEKIAVKVDGPAKIELKEGEMPQVKFVGLEVKLYRDNNKEIQFTCKATAVELLNK